MCVCVHVKYFIHMCYIFKANTVMLNFFFTMMQMALVSVSVFYPYTSIGIHALLTCYLIRHAISIIADWQLYFNGKCNIEITRVVREFLEDVY